MIIYTHGVRVLELEERRVRLRVFLADYDPSQPHSDLLPHGRSFFFCVLWQAADGEAGRRRGPLNVRVALEDTLDPDWVEANASRFIESVERVSARNLPPGDELAGFYETHYTELDRRLHRWHERWEHENLLIQADYDVVVTDARWLEPLREGQGMGTGFASWGRTVAGGQLVRRGLILKDQGDREGAAHAFRRATAVDDPEATVRALLALDDLDTYLDALRFDAQIAHEARAALELCVRLSEEGRDAEARAAFLLVHSFGRPEFMGEARERAGMESPAERAHRLMSEGDRAGALKELRRAYDGGDEVIDFAVALLDGDFETADATLPGGDLDRTRMALIATDLVFVHAREGGDDVVAALLELRVTAELGSTMWRYALASGNAYPEEVTAAIGERLMWTAVAMHLPEEVRDIAETAGARFPGLAAAAYAAIGDHYTTFGEPEDEADAWVRAAYWTSVAELGGTEPAARALITLARSLDATGYPVAAAAARAAATETAGPELAAGASYAVFSYARLLLRAGHEHRAWHLLLTIAGEGDRGAAEAMMLLGHHAESVGDREMARQWWLCAAASDQPAMVRSAAMELGYLAKIARDAPEARRWYGPVVESDDESAALAAAHLGELHYWLGDKEESLRWYDRTLSGTDDPELVGEAALRVGEMRGDPTALRRAADSGHAGFAEQALTLLSELERQRRE
ncbi:hypothetical protein ACQP2T_31075 [Nonomuraea sp. CA-143628]|uniref:tetratricopeptide repeat protein n=1 Tax=Nonomuraea sp. CA-143628 TaxID=3239997 RepID=UPI003D91631D